MHVLSTPVACLVAVSVAAVVVVPIVVAIVAFVPVVDDVASLSSADVDVGSMSFGFVVVVVVPQCHVASLMIVGRLTTAYDFEYSWLVMLEVSCRCCSGVVAVKMGPSLSSGLSCGGAR